MSEFKITIVKAFTRDAELGNPAVVIEAPIESPEALEALRNADYSVAAVIDSTQPKPVPIRFFYEFGRTETLACGHATLAAAHVLLPQGEAQNAFINQKGQIVEVVKRKDGRISQKQPTPEFAETNCSAEEAAEALGIQKEEVLSSLPIKLVGAPGKMKLLIPTTLQAILRINRAHKKIMKLCRQTSATGLFPFAVDTEGCDAHARHFPNRDEEDLICGVGSLALAHYFKNHTRTEKNEFVIRCGPGAKGVGDVIVRINGEQMFLEGYAVSI